MPRLALAVLLLMVAPAGASAQPQGGDDRVVITGPVTIERNETAKDVVVVDGPVSVAGRVSGDVLVANGDVRVSGTIDGDLIALAKRVTLESGARIGGDLVYGDERPAVAGGATVEGETSRVDVDEASSGFGWVGALAMWIAVSVSTLVLGLLLLWLAPRALEAAWEGASTRLGAGIGWGLLLFFGIPVVAIIALVTLVGIPFGVGLLLVLLPLYAIGYTTSAWLLGRRLLGPPRGAVLSFVAGLGILRLLALIPVVGGLAWFAATVLGLGALAIAVWRARGEGAYRAAAGAA